MRLATALVLLLFSVPGFGCKSSQIGGDEVEVAELNDLDFPDAIRLSNGTVNLVVVPSIGGRIMRYGYVGGPNLLWNNPKAVDVARERDRDDPPTTRAAAHVNYGGDKAWPWPQDQWPLLIGRTYPPPAEADQAAYKSRLVGSLGVRLESPPIPSHGAKIVREIRLQPSGTRVTIVTRLQQTTADRPPPELAAWSVTQIVGDSRVYARLRHDGITRPMQPAPAPPTTRPIAPRIIAINPPLPKPGKLGLDADVLAAAVGDTLFVQRSPTAAAKSGGYRAAERAQVFFQQADKPDLKRPRYAELEFTSPRQDLAAGEVPELRVTWELRRSGRGWSDQAVAAALSALDAPDPANLLPPRTVP